MTEEATRRVWDLPVRITHWLLVLGIGGSYATHQAGGHGKEVGAILPLNAPDINQLEVDLVDERGGLKYVVRALRGHVPPGDALELAVHKREQFLDSPVVPRSPFDEQRGHALRSVVSSPGSADGAKQARTHHCDA